MASNKLYRVKRPGQAAVVHPRSGSYVVPDPTKAYSGDDALVKAYPHLFESDEDRAVESATAEPGEKRRIGRPPLPRDADGKIIRED